MVLKIEKTLGRKDIMSLTPIIVIDVWGIDFMRPFPCSLGNECVLAFGVCV